MGFTLIEDPEESLSAEIGLALNNFMSRISALLVTRTIRAKPFCRKQEVSEPPANSMFKLCGQSELFLRAGLSATKFTRTHTHGKGYEHGTVKPRLCDTLRRQNLPVDTPKLETP